MQRDGAIGCHSRVLLDNNGISCMALQTLPSSLSLRQGPPTAAETLSKGCQAISWVATQLSAVINRKGQLGQRS